jgi:pilus assembly protein CpaB
MKGATMSSNRRRVTGIIAALGLAVAGTFALVAYVQGAEDRALAGERVVDVYVATQDIAAGTPAAQLAGKVERERVPAKVQARGAVERLASLNGYVTSVDLVRGEQLVRARFSKEGVTPVRRTAGGTKIPVGWFQTTILLEPDQALGGTVKAGQRVAIVASLGLSSTNGAPVGGMVVRNGLVTNVQIDGDRGDDIDRKTITNAPTGKFLVTIAVPQAELERLVYAVDQGNVWLATEPDSR